MLMQMKMVLVQKPQTGDDGSGVFDCDAVPGMSSNMMDCDDADAAVNPSASESVTALTMTVTV